LGFDATSINRFAQLIEAQPIEAQSFEAQSIERGCATTAPGKSIPFVSDFDQPWTSAAPHLQSALHAAFYGGGGDGGGGGDEDGGGGGHLVESNWELLPPWWQLEAYTSGGERGAAPLAIGKRSCPPAPARVAALSSPIARWARRST
jgi:hypothetical protein